MPRTQQDILASGEALTARISQLERHAATWREAARGLRTEAATLDAHADRADATRADLEEERQALRSEYATLRTASPEAA